MISYHLVLSHFYEEIILWFLFSLFHDKLIALFPFPSLPLCLSLTPLITAPSSSSPFSLGPFFFFFSSRFTGHFFLLSFFLINFFIFIQICIWRFSVARPVKWNFFILWFWFFFSNIVVYVVLCGLGIARLK